MARFPTLAACLAVFTVAVFAARPASQPGQPGQAVLATPGNLDATIDRAFHAAYNLDYDTATRLARQALAANPAEARAHRTLASVLWLNILFNRGAVTVDVYLGGLTRARLTMPPPPPALDAEFKKELDLSISIAEAQLKKNPKDLVARYDTGAAYALQASYTASVDGSLMSAFGSAKRAFNAHEEVLEKDPTRADAGVIVGTYRYIVSALSFPTRMFAYLAGFGGGKEKGIALLQAADKQPTGHPEASIALILIYSREGQHTEALRLVRRLEVEYPGNRLFVLEEGSIAIRANLPADAEAALSRGMAICEQDPRPKIPSERALWLYKRGVARVMLNHRADASVDLRGALQLIPNDWLGGKIHLELGKLADLAGDRPGAVAEYKLARGLCEGVSETTCATDAARLSRQPYK